MPKFPIGAVLRLIPALTEALGGLIQATRKDSDGGKRVTRAEADAITSELLEDLRPIVLAEVVKHLDVVD
jgi:hypothetical protein